MCITTFVMVLACLLAQGDNLSDVKVKSLSYLQPDNVGKEYLVASYAALISGNLGDENVGCAMLSLGDLYELSNPTAGIVPEPGKALYWYRSARDASRPGSEVWRVSSLKLCRRLRDAPQVEAAQIEQSRAILQEVKSSTKGMSSESIEVDFELVLQTIREERFDDALDGCQKIKADVANLVRNTDRTEDCKRLMLLVDSAPGVLIDAWVDSSRSVEEKRGAVVEIARRFPDSVRTQSLATGVLERLPGVTDGVLRGRSNTWWPVAFAHLCFLSVFLFAWRRQYRSAS